MPPIAVIDDPQSRSSDLYTLEVAPDRDSPWDSEFHRFRRGHLSVRGALGGTRNPSRLGFDVLHKHETEAGVENRLRFGGIERGSVRLVPPDITHAEPVTTGMKRHSGSGSYTLRSIDAADAVRRRENVAWECHG